MKKNSSAFKIAWRYFSLYVRLIECIESTGSHEQGYCCTCNQLTQFCDLDAGHYIPGRTNAVIFVRELVHIQCRTCNQINGGKYEKYKIFMENKYGKERVEEFDRLKFKSEKISDFDLEQIKKYYIKKITEIGFAWII